MAGTMPPPTRGRPYYDVARGRKMIVPKEGGKAIPFVGEASEWTPKRALRRAGIRATAAGDRAARRAPGAAFDAAKASGGIPQLGVGQLVLYVFVSILALALLENVLGGPGSGAVSKILAFFGGTITRLVSPTDPLVPRGGVPPPVQPPANFATATATTPGATAGAQPSAVMGGGGPAYKKSPNVVAGVHFSGASLVGTNTKLIAGVAAVVRAAGGTLVNVISARRSTASNAAAGGVQDSNHLTGDAIDATVFIPKTGWVPLGSLPGWGKLGLRTGDVAGFFNGHPDPNHVDTGANQ